MNRGLARTALAVSLLWPAAAGASHSPKMPEPRRILARADDPRQLVVTTRNGGLYRTLDGGQTWFNVCHEALGADDAEAYPGVFSAAGTLVMSTGYRGVSTSVDGCTWREWFPELPGLVQDVAVAAGGRLLALNEGAASGSWNAVWSSADEGATFVPEGTPLPPDSNGVSVGASADGSRWFVTARGTPAPELYRTGDRGATWVHTALPGDGSVEPRLVGVTAGPIERVVVVLTHPVAGDAAAPRDSVVASEDGGATWLTVLEGNGALPGAVLSPDGTLLVGGPSDGILRVPLGEPAIGAPIPFSTTPTLGLAVAEGLVFSIGRELIDGYSVAVTSDGGATFVPILSFCTTQITRACPEGSTVKLECSRGIETDPWQPQGDVCSADASPRPDAAPPADAGRTAASGRQPTAALASASCSAASGGGRDRRGQGPALVVIAVALGTAGSRRRRAGGEM